MKKNKKLLINKPARRAWRRLVAIAFTGILLSALSGCGKKEETEETKKEGFAYVPAYAQMDIGNDYVYSAAAAGDNLYIFTQSWDDETDKSINNIYKYNIQANAPDGGSEEKSNVEKIPVEIGDNISVSTMTAGADGEIYMVLNRYSYGEDEEEGTVDSEVPDAAQSGESSEGEESTEDEDVGTAESAETATAVASSEVSVAGGMTESSQTLELWHVSPEDGSIKEKIDITELMGGSNTEYVYVQYFCIDGQGNFYLYDGDQGLHIIDKEYQKVCDISADNWINSMAASKEGDVYISTYGENGMEMRKVDLSTKSIGNAIEGAATGYRNQNFYTGAEKSFLVTDSDQVLRLDVATAEKEELFNWLDMDINSDNIRYAGELADGRIWALTIDYSEEGAKSELVFVVKKDASEVPEKEEIVYGTMWVDYTIKRKIIDFNKKSDKYRITVKEYATDDYESGMTQFNADLTTENCPDIISLTTLDFNQYVSKGVLEDLYPYMEKSGYNKSDFVENVMQAYEVDGGLYGIMSQFYVDTTMGKKSLLGDKTGWTLSEMLDFAESVDAENIFGYGTRSSIFYYCIFNNIDEFIDWESGKCSFDGEDFIRVLEFAAKFPEEYSRDGEEEGTSARLRSDKVLLLQNSLTSVQEYQMMVGMFGEPITFVGYPNKERSGNLIQPSGGAMGLSAKSEKKEGAWEFMQTILSEEYQKTLLSEHGSSGFPVRKSVLEEQFKLDMTPDYYEDENGEQVESPKTHWGWDDFDMEIMAATQEEVDAVKAVIASASKVTSSNGVDSQLSTIITEEAEAFFKGQKSAADVAGIIQNRVQIYVNENR